MCRIPSSDADSSQNRSRAVGCRVRHALALTKAVVQPNWRVLHCVGISSFLSMYDKGIGRMNSPCFW